MLDTFWLETLVGYFLVGFAVNVGVSNFIPLQVNEDDLTDVQAVIDGPPGTPYQGDQIYPSPLYIRYTCVKHNTPCQGDEIHTQIYTKCNIP